MRLRAGKKLLMGLTHKVVNIFIGVMREFRQRLLEISRAEKERGGLSVAQGREAGKNSGDSRIARGREWSIAKRSK